MQMAMGDMPMVPARPAGFWANLKVTCFKYGKMLFRYGYVPLVIYLGMTDKWNIAYRELLPF
ncbi:hypothetical protein JH06_2832 [Blastocystis sp. subtype 4]|uniref:hypothetical protein n=1 Tax=Blastocystis sp. subtype 4 TaxID=944170 RepID=UPI000711CEB1|nr:hypothetical protein JH06_2832 [Blastocystis sp. subtype 4]KNB44939.1 hypothetical protein JH06_2832 [Blastocystis sp. subtype 4]|eukprot:XP_014528380.1 hypothetical protein JH06_2832 [Blastocystis sp. subtype 4]